MEYIIDLNGERVNLQDIPNYQIVNNMFVEVLGEEIDGEREVEGTFDLHKDSE